MNSVLLLAWGAFGAAFLFAAVITAWRDRIADALQQDPPAEDGAWPFVTLVVPVRNGEATITFLLQDLYAQAYPKELVEVIVVDDDSTDRTADIVRGMQRNWPGLSLQRAVGSGKKAAITTGVRHARGELIILTDADARCGPSRVARFVREWKRTRADMLLGPVRTLNSGGIVGAVQEDEQAALLGVAAATGLGGKAMLANGANMAFRAKAFDAVGGYHGDPYASGDDIFLLDRMKRDDRKIAFVLHKEALVTVEAERSFTGFWHQRLRWAGKMRGVPGTGRWIPALAMLFPWGLLTLTILIPWTDAANHGFARAALLIVGAWMLWSLPVIGLAVDLKRFMDMPPQRARMPMSLLAFTGYAPLIALVSLFVRPRWKGRPLR